jgi:hypothetical protein
MWLLFLVMLGGGYGSAHATGLGVGGSAAVAWTLTIIGGVAFHRYRERRRAEALYAAYVYHQAAYEARQREQQVQASGAAQDRPGVEASPT